MGGVPSSQHRQELLPLPPVQLARPLPRNSSITTDRTCSDRPWPRGRLEVMLPIVLDPANTLRNREWVDIFLRGLLLHWPVAASGLVVNLVLDTEVRATAPHLVDAHVTRVVAAGRRKLGAAFPTVRIAYNRPMLRLYGTGHDRQQYLMFWADTWVSSRAEFVAFFDTDVLLHR
jgi:hypothetical protein